MASQEATMPSHDNRGPGLIAELYIVQVATVFMVAVRIYVSARLTHIFDASDVWIFIATALMIVGSAFCTMLVKTGMGHHMVYLKNPEHDSLQILRWNTYYQITMLLTTLFTKYSIAFYILRIKKDRSVKVVLGAMMLLVTLATLATEVALFVSCSPLRKVWEPTIKGTCLPREAIYSIPYAQSACTILVDLVLTLSPIFILWNVRIRKGRKTFICFLMSLGLVATVANALRNAFVPGLTSPDFPYDMVPVTIVVILEQGSGIIAACVPTCIPLITQRMHSSAAKSIQQSSYYFPKRVHEAFGSGRDAIYVSTVLDSVSNSEDAQPLTELQKTRIKTTVGKS